MGLLARAKLLAPRPGPAPNGDVECMRFTDKFLKARDDVDAENFGYAACPAAAESLRAGLASLTASSSARIPSRPSSAQVLAILAAIVTGEAELAPFDPARASSSTEESLPPCAGRSTSSERRATTATAGASPRTRCLWRG